MRIDEQWPGWTGTIRVVIRDRRGRFMRGSGHTFRNLIVNSGLNLVRDGIIGAAADTRIKYVALGTGCGVLSSALASGTAYTSLAMAVGIPHALTNGQSLTIINGASSQVVTTSSSVSAGATSIPVTSFTANANYPINTTSVVPTPAAGDTTLHTETFRKAVTSQVAGGSAGQAVTTVYLSPQDANVVIAELGWFAGSSATATANSGTMIARVLYNHNHTNLESINVQRNDNGI